MERKRGRGCGYIPGRSGGEMRITPSPLTNNIGTLRLVVCVRGRGKGVRDRRRSEERWCVRWRSALRFTHLVNLLKRLFVQLHGSNDLLHVTQNHVQVLVVRLGGRKQLPHVTLRAQLLERRSNTFAVSRASRSDQTHVQTAF